MGRSKGSTNKIKPVKKPREREKATTEAVTLESTEPALTLENRMMEYGNGNGLSKKRPPCPECGACPVVCVQRIKGFASYRCRACGRRFTTGNLLEKRS